MSLKLSKDIGEFLIDLMQGNPQLLVIEGPIGSGKSLLSKTIFDSLMCPRPATRISALKNDFDEITISCLADNRLIVLEDAVDIPAAVHHTLPRQKIILDRFGEPARTVPNRISFIVVKRAEG